jgi:hypothetical protein
MTVKWRRGRNPYVHNAFGVLQLGAFATPNTIGPQENKLKRRIKTGKQIEIGGQPLTEHDIAQASNKLRDPYGRAESLLLVHRQQKLDQKRLKKLSAEVIEVCAQETHETIPFRSLTSLFWFVPLPDVDVIPMPDWESLEIDAVGSDVDLQLDIVWDA